MKSEERKKIKEKINTDFLISKDIKNIDEILYKKEKYLKEIEVLDRKILLIQKSTQTTFSSLRLLHDILRQKYKWYYNWHLWSYSKMVHFLVLGAYLLAIVLFGVNYFYAPKVVKAIPLSCVYTESTDQDWLNVSNWSGCGGEYPGQNATNVYNVTIPAGETASIIIGTPLIDLYGGNINVDGTLNLDQGTLTINDFTLGSGGVVSPASGFQINVSGTWDSSDGDIGTSNLITFDSSSNDQFLIAKTGQVFTTIKHTGSASLILQSPIKVDFEFINSAGSVFSDGFDQVFKGYWANQVGATYDAGGALTTFQNTTICNSGGLYNTSEININGVVNVSCGSLITSAENINVSGSLVIGSQLLGTYGQLSILSGGTVSLTTGILRLGYSLNIASGGTLSTGTGTVELNAGNDGQTISASSGLNIYNLNITNTSAGGVNLNASLTIGNTLTYHRSGGRINFGGGTTQAINRLDLLGGSGDVGNSLKLRSVNPGQGYNLALTNISNFDYVDLQDACNTGGQISIAHAKDSGGNSNFYLTNSYATTASALEKAGIGWQETVTAKDFYGGTAISDTTTTFDISSSSLSVKFYTDSTYKTQTSSYTLSSGVAIIYLKSSSTKDEEITYTITDSHGKTATSGIISVAGSPLTLANLPTKIVEEIIPKLPIKEETKVAEKLAETLTPVAQALVVIGLIPLILQILQAIPSAAPLASSVFPVLFTTASVRRRKKPWGNVFDSLTGQAVDLAVVRLYEEKTNRLISTQVTDFDGRFNFLAQAGTYYIKVEKKGYQFPVKISKFKASQLSSRFGKDSDIYLGVPFVVKDKNAQINLNIPVDPILEKMTNRIKLKKSVKEGFDWFLIITSYIAIPLMLLGTAITALATVYKPSIFNFITDGAYLVLLFGFLATSRIQKNRLGKVFDSQTKESIAGAMVMVFDQEYNAIRQTQTTDKNGNFAILAQKGVYYLVVEKNGYKFPTTRVQSTKKQPVYTGGVIKKPKPGFLGLDIPVDKK